MSDELITSNTAATRARIGDSSVAAKYVQQQIDAVVRWAHQGKTAWTALRGLRKYVVQEDLCDQVDLGAAILAYPPSALPSCAELLSEVANHDVRDYYGFPPSKRISATQKGTYFVEVTLSASLEDGDDRWESLAPLTISSFNGRSATIPVTCEGAMMSAEMAYTWHEPKRTWEHAITDFEARFWITDIDRWRRLTPARQRAFFRR